MEDLDKVVLNLQGLLKSQQNNSQKQIRVIQLAIIQINNCNTNEERELVIEAMIKGYILDEIYELIGSLNFQLQEYIVEFLQFFVESTTIYSCNQSTLLLQAITRSLHYFLKDQENYQAVLMKYLHLETVILKKYDPQLFYQNSLQLADLLKSLMPILASDFINIKYKVVDLIRVIFKNWTSKEWRNTEEDFVLTIKCAQTIFQKEYLEKIVPLFAIANTIIGCCNDLDQVMKGIKMIILDIIVSFIVNDVCECIAKLSTTDISHWETFDMFFSCIRNIYNFEENREKLFDLSDKLMSINILSIIFTRIKQYSTLFQSRAKLMKLLYEIVLNLSLQKLNFGQTSSPEAENFAENLLVGIQGLFENCEMWPKLLPIHYFFDSYQAIMIIAYFWNQNSNISYFKFESLSDFIVRISETEKYPVFILRILWFNFAVAAFSENTSRIELQTFGASSVPRLIQLMKSSLKDVLMYHPIILGSIFLFPQFIPQTFQEETIKLFLFQTVEGTKNYEYLVLMLFHNTNFCDCVFAIIKKSTKPEELKQLLRLLKICFNYKMSENVANFFAQCMLKTLPSLILKMESENSYPDLKKEIIFWFSKVFLTKWNQEAIINCNVAIFDLVQIIIDKPKKFQTCSLILRLFSMILNSEVLSTVAENFLNNLQLVESLMNWMEEENPIITALSTHVLEKLLKKQITLNSNFKNLIIDLNRIPLDYDPTKELQFKMKLSFVQTLIESNVLLNHPILKIRRDSETPEQIRVLYFKISMMATEVSLEPTIWRCLNSILNFVRENYRHTLLINQICMQPWTSVLIEKKFGIKNSRGYYYKDINVYDENFFQYLSSWLHFVKLLLQQHEEENGEELADLSEGFSLQIQSQVISISNIFIQNYFPKWNLLSLDVQKRVITCSDFISSMKELLPHDVASNFSSTRKANLEYDL